MSEFFSPFDADRPLMLKCSCGRDHTAADHQAETAAASAATTLRERSLTSEFEAYSKEFIEATLVKALFPQDAVRRRFLPRVAAGTAGWMAVLGWPIPRHLAEDGAAAEAEGHSVVYLGWAREVRAVLWLDDAVRADFGARPDHDVHAR